MIRKANELTDWVSSMDVVAKPKSNKLRACLDPKDLNCPIMREHLELPTVEENNIKDNCSKGLFKN